MNSALLQFLAPPQRNELQRRPFSEQVAALQRGRLLAVALDHAQRQGYRLAPVEQGLWDSLVVTQSASVERDNAVLKRLLSTLDARGCPALLLKGAALGRWLYAAPALRPVSDFDLMVAADQRLNAHQALIDLGFISDGYSQHDLISNQARYCDRESGRFVDLHWALHVLPELACRFDFNELMERSVALQAPSKGRALCRVDALMHAVVHFHAHQPPRNRPAIWLHDLALLVRGLSAVEWADLDRAVRAKRFAGLHAEALLEVQQWFELDLPADLIAQWQQLGLGECSRNLINANQGHVARMRRSLACLPTMQQRLAYLLICLFPAREWMRGRYAAATSTQLLRAYVIRWFAGAKESVATPVPATGTFERTSPSRGHR